jgi:hypothetical protein
LIESRVLALNVFENSGLQSSARGIYAGEKINLWKRTNFGISWRAQACA